MSYHQTDSGESIVSHILHFGVRPQLLLPEKEFFLNLTLIADITYTFSLFFKFKSSMEDLEYFG